MRSPGRRPGEHAGLAQARGRWRRGRDFKQARAVVPVEIERPRELEQRGARRRRSAPAVRRSPQRITISLPAGAQQLGELAQLLGIGGRDTRGLLELAAVERRG